MSRQERIDELHRLIAATKKVKGQCSLLAVLNDIAGYRQLTVTPYIANMIPAPRNGNLLDKAFNLLRTYYGLSILEDLSHRKPSKQRMYAQLWLFNTLLAEVYTLKE